jgi:MazG family protein
MPDLTPLTELMAALRDPDTGCPWDIKQTNQSIASHTLEETYELLHAIESKDLSHLREELGDLLFHIVFHSRIAEEAGHFAMDDVIDDIVQKMILRHPHVFDPERDNRIDETQLSAQWEAQKRREKNKPQRGLDEVGQKLPAMMRAQKLQDEAAKQHFDWPDSAPVLDKIEEEIAELREALQSGDSTKVRDEMGDLLFACINLARHVNVDAESSLRQTNEKFIRRFDYVMQHMQRAGIEPSPGQLGLMENYWQQSKKVTG